MTLSIKEITNLICTYSDYPIDESEKDRAAVISEAAQTALEESQLECIGPQRNLLSYGTDTRDNLRIVDHIFNIPAFEGQIPGYNTAEWKLLLNLISEMITELSLVDPDSSFSERTRAASAFQSAYPANFALGGPRLGPKKAKEIMNAIQKGKLKILPIGYSGTADALGHAFVLVFCKGYFAICNTLGKITIENIVIDSSIKAFKIDPTLVTPEIVTEIYAVNSRDRDASIKYYYKTLPESLSPEKKALKDDLCTAMEKVSRPMQKYNYCTWESTVLAVIPALVLINPDRNPEQAGQFTEQLSTYIKVKMLNSFSPKNLDFYSLPGHSEIFVDTNLLSYCVTDATTELIKQKKIHDFAVKYIQNANILKLIVSKEDNVFVSTIAKLCPNATIYDPSEWAKLAPRQSDYKARALLGFILERIKRWRESNDEADKKHHVHCLKIDLRCFSPSFLEKVYYCVWELSGKPDVENWGEKHALDNVETFSTVMEKLTLKLFEELPQETKNTVYGRIYAYACRPKTNDPQWGEHHAKDNLIRLADVLLLG